MRRRKKPHGPTKGRKEEEIYHDKQIRGGLVGKDGLTICCNRNAVQDCYNRTGPSETLDTKDTFEEDPEEYDEDEASSNEESEDEGKKESMAANKKQDAVAKHNAMRKIVATK